MQVICIFGLCKVSEFPERNAGAAELHNNSEGLACIWGPLPPHTQSYASFPGHCADGRREGGGGFPQLSPDLGDRGWQAGGGECPAGSWGDWSVFLPPAMAPERRASEQLAL